MVPKRINILFCVEKGVLEQQAILLVKSIKKWLKSFDYKIHAYSPRLGYWPKEQTITDLTSLGVNWVNVPLNFDFGDYPIANKVLACKHFEFNHPDEQTVLFVDTDTVFLNGIDSSLLSAHKKLYLRPVDNKGPGSESSDDVNDVFWQKVFARCGVQLPDANVQTTVRPAVIRNYFNAGLIWKQGLGDFFKQWHADFMTIVDSDLRPFGYQSRDGDDFRCLDQVALAVTATRYTESLEVLPETFNYPLPFRPIMHSRKNHPEFDQLVHVHYHKWFQHPDFLQHITNAQEQATDVYVWLQANLPLEPSIDEPFKC